MNEIKDITENIKSIVAKSKQQLELQTNFTLINLNINLALRAYKR